VGFPLPPPPTLLGFSYLLFPLSLETWSRLFSLAASLHHLCGRKCDEKSTLVKGRNPNDGIKKSEHTTENRRLINECDNTAFTHEST
jgi:hypothetical protein